MECPKEELVPLTNIIVYTIVATCWLRYDCGKFQLSLVWIVIFLLPFSFYCCWWGWGTMSNDIDSLLTLKLWYASSDLQLCTTFSF